MTPEHDDKGWVIPINLDPLQVSYSRIPGEFRGPYLIIPILPNLALIGHDVPGTPTLDSGGLDPAIHVSKLPTICLVGIFR